jgi:hypothetical protein
MNTENQAKAKANVQRINTMTDDELFTMFKAGKCPYEPEHLIGVPLGIFHCKVCGLMICAGLEHGPIKWIGDFKTGHADYPDEVYEKIAQRELELKDKGR